MAKYDTSEIRRAARIIKSSQERLHGSTVTKLRGVQSSLNGEFQGEAADALNTRLKKMDTDARRIEEKLEGMYSVLMRFAQRLDETDQKISTSIR